MSIDSQSQFDAEDLRQQFESMANDPTYKFRRSRRGMYVNPAVSRDWKWFQSGAAQKALALTRSASDIAMQIIRGVCETDPADPKLKDTLCISVVDLKAIVDAALADLALTRPAVPEGWRELAGQVMDALAEAQEQTNASYPDHVKCYPQWVSHARWCRWHAEMFRTGKPIGNGAGNTKVLEALAAAPQPPSAEPLARFCPGCGSVGPVDPKFRDCCPDGNKARLIPQRLAEHCHDLFQAALRPWIDVTDDTMRAIRTRALDEFGTGQAQGELWDQILMRETARTIQAAAKGGA